jgi:REP-associated tyrosine transposase
MARLPRFQLLVIHGNIRELIFYVDEDYLFYLEKLKQACSIHTYVLMRIMYVYY